MGFCTRCGFELGIGRFCTNCGHPVTGDSVPPSGPRFPLYADEVAAAPSEVPASADPPTATLPAVPPAGRPDDTARHPARTRSRWQPLWRPPLGWLPLAVIGLVMALLLWGGIWLLTGGGAPDETSKDLVTQPGEVTELASTTTPRVPTTAPPNQSLSGAPVDYRARNLLDGDRATAWRMPGDGTGAEIVLELGEESVVTSVGLVNGYAKTDTDQAGNPVRWYRHNRRIEQVTWVFDDGTEVVQRLRSTQRMQAIDIDPARTSSVRLRLDAVSAPGPTERARDFTSISEVTITGAPAGSD